MESSNNHFPVMMNEVMEMFSQASITPKNYLDGTFGRGGHASKVAETYPDIDVYALDKDQQALEFAKGPWGERQQKKKFFIEQESFAKIDEVIERQLWPEKYDMILLDLGVSSPQLDNADRGFSFYQPGPLDMRMDRREAITAEEVVNHWSEEELVEVFREYGEVFRPYNVVKSIVRERAKQKISSTVGLSKIIERSIGWQKKGKHPATKYFMALRLVVNREMEDLKDGIQRLMERLVPGGRLVVLTFHSMEDRIVKHIFKNSELGRPVHKKVVKPTREEVLANKRSRSAKLRGFEKELEKSEEETTS